MRRFLATFALVAAGALALGEGIQMLQTGPLELGFPFPFLRQGVLLLRPAESGGRSIRGPVRFSGLALALDLGAYSGAALVIDWLLRRRSKR